MLTIVKPLTKLLAGKIPVSIKDVGVQDTLAHSCETLHGKACSKKSTDVKTSVNRVLQDYSMRSAEKLVFDAVAFCKGKSMEVKSSNISIIESLAWIFISYRSRKPEWFPHRHLTRFHRSLKQTYDLIQEFANGDYREYTYCKYWLDVLLCRLAKDPSLPERKDWNTKPLFTGYLKRITDKAVHRRNRYDDMLILSLQKGAKKMWSNINDEPYLLKKDLEFAKRLETPRANISALMKTFILDSARLTFRDLIDHKMTLTGKIPSNRACWENTVPNGGAQALYHALRIPRDLGPEAVSVVQYRERATAKKEGQLLITRRKREYDTNTVIEVDYERLLKSQTSNPLSDDTSALPLQESTNSYRESAIVVEPIVTIRKSEGSNPIPSEDELNDLVVRYGVLRGMNMGIQTYLQRVYNDAMKGSRYECENPSSVCEKVDNVEKEHYPALTINRVARIAEAGGKIRYVSAGSGFAYTALRPLQEAMLKCWKQMPESTMLEDDLLESIRRIDTEVKLPYWCSVDYEAATDLLNRDSSYSVLAALLEGAVPSVDLAWESFGPGIMILPDESSFIHVEGQLMGHVLSFPMLCVINRAVLHATISRWVLEGPNLMEDWGNTKLSRIEIGEIVIRNVKINGDDMVFKSNRRIYELFLEVSKEVGFKISVGKNYLSEDFCMINSQFYRRHEGVMDRIGYLNLQLVKGTSSKKGDSDATPTDIGASMNKMIDLCPWAQCTIPAAIKCAEKKLLKKKVQWSEVYRTLGTERAWYGSPSLGAYGIDLKYAPKSWKPTRNQRLLAAMMVTDTRLATYSRNKIAPRTMKMIDKFIHPTAVFRWTVEGPCESNGSLPLLDNHQPLKDDKWFPRLLFAAQAAFPPFLGDSSFTILNSIERDKRLHPMSILKYMNFQEPQMQTTIGPDCPPFPPLLMERFQPRVYIQPPIELSVGDSWPGDGWYLGNQPSNDNHRTVKAINKSNLYDEVDGLVSIQSELNQLYL